MYPIHFPATSLLSRATDFGSRSQFHEHVRQVNGEFIALVAPHLSRITRQLLFRLERIIRCYCYRKRNKI